MWQLAWLFVASVAAATSGGHWAIELAPNQDAHTFARAHGLEYHGPIGVLSRHFYFTGNWSGGRQRDVGVEWSALQTRRRHWTRGDPLYGAQWHLHLYDQDVGVNAPGVWAQTRGAGVTIAIVDDGLQSNHPDLQARFSRADSWDFNGAHGMDPVPGREDAHGTACAGVCCAQENNNVCGVGVCPECRVSGLRLIAGSVSDMEEATALSHHSDSIDIYSCSWGPADDGRRMEGPGHLLELTLERQVEKGRRGKGSIYVWAAGNGGHVGDNCNYDGYANSRYTIAIGAVDSGGFRSYYSEPCSALFAVAPSSGVRGITTTDLTGADGYSSGNCTSTFGGTSSAAPLAAGIVALLLSARPDLTWRDVQHVIASGATKININHPSYGRANARGYLHSHEYGFGNLVVPRLLQTAMAHQLVAPQRLLCQALICPNPEGPNGFVEHVQVTIAWRHGCRGKTVFTLYSPSGQQSQLSQVHADCTAGSTTWSFRSVAHWGEHPTGTWRLQMQDASGTSQLQSVALKVWGF